MGFKRGNKVGRRFRPGESGNPAGRPKRTRLTEALIAELATGDDQTTAERVAAALIREALAGNVQAIREVFDRAEGKPRQALDVGIVSADWREAAALAGLTEAEVIAEARRLIEHESDTE